MRTIVVLPTKFTGAGITAIVREATDNVQGVSFRCGMCELENREVQGIGQGGDDLATHIVVTPRYSLWLNPDDLYSIVALNSCHWKIDKIARTRPNLYRQAKVFMDFEKRFTFAASAIHTD